mmetsp:Transcript_9313/g.23454  ORF Transcript_9313/g.23454 Transcript_9313/m.23454 type:complete len:94 (+) Transcript_9313:133-414(+)
MVDRTTDMVYDKHSSVWRGVSHSECVDHRPIRGSVSERQQDGTDQSTNDQIGDGERSTPRSVRMMKQSPMHPIIRPLTFYTPLPVKLALDMPP